MDEPLGSADNSWHSPTRSFRDLLDIRDPDQQSSLATPRESLRHFDPVRANLQVDPPDYVIDHLLRYARSRPWLESVRSELTDLQRLFVAVDKGKGHLLQRHGPWLTPEMTFQRVSQLRDPAIVRPELRLPGVDAYRNHLHRCGAAATRFTDPYAFGTCFARGIEHPRVRRGLDREFDPAKTARPCRIPLCQLLGPNGYLFVDGHRLEPIDGDIDRAMFLRAAWACTATRHPAEAGAPPPASRISNFEGAEVVFAFRADCETRQFEIESMYVTLPVSPA